MILGCSCGDRLNVRDAGMSRLTPEERYQRDPSFHALVHILRGELQKGNYTPTELREACLLAATFHEAYAEPARFIDPRASLSTIRKGP